MVNIRRIEPRDVTDVKALADTCREELGFNPRKKFEEVASEQRGLVAFDSLVIAGFVIFRHRKADLQTTLSEICVRETYRHRHIGTDLVTALINLCSQMSREFIQLKCPVELPANEFYRHIGFHLYTTEAGKKRSLNVWRLTVPPKPANET